MQKLYIFFLTIFITCFHLDCAAEKIVSVYDFGARGNDIRDDTEAFQKAIDAAVRIRSNVFVPAGNYFISDVNLKSKVLPHFLLKNPGHKTDYKLNVFQNGKIGSLQNIFFRFK